MTEAQLKYTTAFLILITIIFVLMNVSNYLIINKRHKPVVKYTIKEILFQTYAFNAVFNIFYIIIIILTIFSLLVYFISTLL
ncbi:MAG TPA: hypothetical protein VN922_19390 [Bacteroidia bacterium]|nr:hypothetical protein [Bacteroidia bacterium]